MISFHFKIIFLKAEVSSRKHVFLVPLHVLKSANSKTIFLAIQFVYPGLASDFKEKSQAFEVYLLHVRVIKGKHYTLGLNES